MPSILRAHQTPSRRQLACEHYCEHYCLSTSSTAKQTITLFTSSSTAESCAHVKFYRSHRRCQLPCISLEHVLSSRHQAADATRAASTSSLTAMFRTFEHTHTTRYDTIRLFGCILSPHPSSQKGDNVDENALRTPHPSSGAQPS
jgi:hypothetical protein